MKNIFNRIFSLAFVMDCVLVALVSVSSMVIYIKMSGLSLKSEEININYDVETLNAGENYEFLVLTHKKDPDRKIVLKTKEPDFVCAVCKNMTNHENHVARK
jgi:hypothetical protein